MQQEFLLNEPVAAQRLVFLFPTTDGVTGKLSGVAGNKAQISIGNAAFVNTINTIVQFTGTTTYPLYYVQLEANEVATLGHGIVTYEGDTWFAGIFKVVSTSNEVSLDEVNAKLDSSLKRLRYIEFAVNRVDKRTQKDPFVSPL